jgi:hypothetical protein
MRPQCDRIATPPQGFTKATTGRKQKAEMKAGPGDRRFPGILCPLLRFSLSGPFQRPEARFVAPPSANFLDDPDSRPASLALLNRQGFGAVQGGLESALPGAMSLVYDCSTVSQAREYLPCQN